MSEIENQKQTVEPKLLNATKSAKRLGVCRTTFYKLVEQGLIKPLRISKRPYYSVDQLDSITKIV